MKNIIILFVSLFLVSVIAWSDDYYGYSNMPWNTSPQEVVSGLDTPDIIMADNHDVVWINRDYFREKYNSLAERFEIDTRKTINVIINEYPNIRFTYYNKKIGTFNTTLSIYFENRFASEELYQIDIEDLSLQDKNKCYDLIKNEFHKKYGTPKNISENNVFKTIKWEKYYTNIEIQLYIASSGRRTSDYLRITYNRSDVSKQLAGMGFDIIDTGKLGEGLTFNQFSSIVEDFKDDFRKRGMEVGDLVPNSQGKDPLTVGINHILHTTNHKNNEVWVTHLYFESLKSSARIYVLFSDKAVGGYYFRGIMLIE